MIYLIVATGYILNFVCWYNVIDDIRERSTAEALFFRFCLIPYLMPLVLLYAYLIDGIEEFTKWWKQR